MTELSLDDDQRNALVCHLDGVRVPELVWREPSTNTRSESGVVQLFACGRGFPVTSCGRPVDHAEERAYWQLMSDLEPWFELGPCPAVHPDLAAFAALAAPDEDCSAIAVKVALPKCERFADPQPGAPQDDDECF